MKTKVIKVGGVADKVKKALDAFIEEEKPSKITNMLQIAKAEWVVIYEPEIIEESTGE